MSIRLHSMSEVPRYLTTVSVLVRRNIEYNFVSIVCCLCIHDFMTNGAMFYPQASEDGADVQPGMEQASEDGDDVQPGMEQASEDGDDVQPGMEQASEDGADIQPGMEKSILASGQGLYLSKAGTCLPGCLLHEASVVPANYGQHQTTQPYWNLLA
ncbi:hypothetical protein VOLCADRAFT_107232 [Volvox carteri f. nagariensis]|uniref:Uncharacterized protein n=1 Tax=Volvox carteri f. nagariensis TaxID=3068 RepID=D8UCR7_VOLCA|nr:uncharacterized protein VOLCADRAFT_107232 [Volvox carteri f. nagariensis]EFJ42436.1 hypothetical protein VOLCADRAFT_107232 [Volvox carteri f. nagariensis]|eukprot:XP_002956499.1 hypothetical protein VOLCADRAFT_107232 [Volvox carteri f. nagariensis]